MVFGRGHTQAEADSQNQRYKDFKAETEVDSETVAFHDSVALQTMQVTEKTYMKELFSTKKSKNKESFQGDIDMKEA